MSIARARYDGVSTAANVCATGFACRRDGRVLAIARKRDPLLVGTEADGVGLFVPASDREFYDPSDVVELEFAGTDDPGGLTLYEHGREKEGIPGRRFSMAP